MPPCHVAIITAMVKSSFHLYFRSSHHPYSIFLSRVKMNSINWPAPNIWVFIAQLVEHCSANAEAMGSNPVEALKFFFFGHKNFLKFFFFAIITAMVKSSFHLYFRSSHHPYSIFLSRVKMNSINWPAPNIWVFIAQLVEHCSTNAEAMGSNPVEALKFFFLQI